MKASAIVLPALSGLLALGSIGGVAAPAKADTASTLTIAGAAAAIVGALMTDNNGRSYYVRDNRRYYVSRDTAQYYREHHRSDYNRGNDNRSYDNRGNDNRNYDNRNYDNRGSDNRDNRGDYNNGYNRH